VTRIDWTVVALAAGGGLVIIAPGALVSEMVAGRVGGWVVWPFLALVLTGFTVSGLVAGRLRDDTPMLHGALGAAFAFLAALVAGVVIAALRDRPLSLAAIPLTALLALTAGVAGSLLADLGRRRAVRR
jgi:hypothetical protein